MLTLRSNLLGLVTFIAFGAPLGVALACGASDPPPHPPDGELPTPEQCKIKDEAQSSCESCTSKAGCGWCDSPASGSATCQPGAADQPPTCTSGWHSNTTECAPPPPPVD